MADDDCYLHKIDVGQLVIINLQNSLFPLHTYFFLTSLHCLLPSCYLDTFDMKDIVQQLCVFRLSSTSWTTSDLTEFYTYSWLEFTYIGSNKNVERSWANQIKFNLCFVTCWSPSQNCKKLSIMDDEKVKITTTTPGCLEFQALSNKVFIDGRWQRRQYV